MFVTMYRRPAVHRLEQEIDSLFDSFLEPAARSSNIVPAVDIAEDESGFVVTAALPGVRKEDLKITVQDSVLTLSGERKAPEAGEKTEWLRRESGYGSFSRTLTLPRETNAQAISAELSDGILRLVIPKAEAARPREIAVK
jgi:HSP20 family protein